MLNTYITNQGMTQTVIHKPTRSYINQTNWDADYDGKIANISLQTNMNGETNTMNMRLDNDDLANLLNIQSVNMPIHERLKMDFEEPQEPLYIELPMLSVESRKPKSVEELIANSPALAMSSPRTNEELIIPMTIDRKTADQYTRTSHRRHKRKKTHITHKVYKKRRTSASSKRRHSSKSHRIARSSSSK